IISLPSMFRHVFEEELFNDLMRHRVSLMFKGSTQCFMMLHNSCDLISGFSN
ncbi:hypothetical protein HGM15179_014636, partial [Zosterops borbonicus]